MSRDAVLTAAKARFASEGYEKTTLRAIAHDAHVDPSMVLYLFGSKADLFRESLQLILDPEILVATLTAGPDDEPDIGTRMVRMYLRIWESPDTGPSMVAMLQSATSNPDAHEAFRGFIQNYVLPRCPKCLAVTNRPGCARCLPAANWWARQCCATS